MTVKELKEFLVTLPNEMEIVHTRCSDYDDVKIEDWSVIRLLPKKYQHNYGAREWYTRYHDSMPDTVESKNYLHLVGN